ncbi:MAG: hypothetical protein ABI199_04870 [Bacteroidia bacterium]
MDPAHIHLLLNHFPIVGLLIVSSILAYGTFRKKQEVITISMYFLVIIALITIVVYLTGDGTAHIVKMLPGINKTDIHNHDEAADSLFWLVELTGILALAYIYVDYKKMKYTTFLIRATLLVSIISFIGMAYVGYLGGKIMHKEIDSNTIITPTTTQQDSIK